jgi:hypothetical protein
VHGLKPGSFRKPTDKIFDAIISDCLAIEIDGECTYPEAVEAVVREMYDYKGHDGEWHAQEHRWDWYAKNSPKVRALALASLKQRKRRAAPASAPPAAAPSKPQPCRGICSGGNVSNPWCAECKRRTAEAKTLKRQRAEISDRERLAAIERKRAEGREALKKIAGGAS